MLVKIVVCGAAGKMGGRILALGAQDSHFSVVGGVEGPEHPWTKQSPAGIGWKISGNLEEFIKDCDVVIEFTSPEATLDHAKIVARHGKAMVIGTTGIDSKGIAAVKKISSKIPVVQSPNMSIGVNLLFKIVHEVARSLPAYDAEIVEVHHNQKKDAPSGTARKLAEAIAKARELDLSKVAVYGREGITGPRKPSEIGIMSVRAGEVVGDHTVLFAGPGEQIELVHKALSRDTFAAGALLAAKWLIDKKPGLYDMQDVLGL